MIEIQQVDTSAKSRWLGVMPGVQQKKNENYDKIQWKSDEYYQRHLSTGKTTKTKRNETIDIQTHLYTYIMQTIYNGAHTKSLI